MPMPRSALSLLAATAMALSLPAQALPIAQNLLAGASASAGGSAATTDTSLTPVLASSSAAETAPDSGSGWGLAWSNQHGAYAVRAGAEGVGAGSSLTRLSYVITNDSATALNYSLRFTIAGGSIGNTVAADATLSGTEFLSSSFEARVRVDDVLRFSAGASLQHGAGGLSFTRSGTDLSGGADDGADGFYDWATADYRVDLGQLAAGQSVRVTAEMSATTAASVGLYEFDCGSASPCAVFKGGAYAFHGDDSDFFGSAATGAGVAPFSVITASPVPEPESFLMLGAGLLALATLRRRPGL